MKRLISQWVRGCVALSLMALPVAFIAILWLIPSTLIGWLVLDILGREGAPWFDRWLAGIWVWVPLAARMVYHSIEHGMIGRAVVLERAKTMPPPTV